MAVPSELQNLFKLNNNSCWFDSTAVSLITCPYAFYRDDITEIDNDFKTRQTDEFAVNREKIKLFKDYLNQTKNDFDNRKNLNPDDRNVIKENCINGNQKSRQMDAGEFLLAYLQHFQYKNDRISSIVTSMNFIQYLTVNDTLTDKNFGDVIIIVIDKNPGDIIPLHNVIQCKNVNYSLSSVLYYSGVVTSGHYTCAFKYNNNLYYYDDINGSARKINNWNDINLNERVAIYTKQSLMAQVYNYFSLTPPVITQPVVQTALSQPLAKPQSPVQTAPSQVAKPQPIVQTAPSQPLAKPQPTVTKPQPTVTKPQPTVTKPQPTVQITPLVPLQISNIKIRYIELRKEICAYYEFDDIADSVNVQLNMNDLNFGPINYENTIKLLNNVFDKTPSDGEKIIKILTAVKEYILNMDNKNIIKVIKSDPIKYALNNKIMYIKIKEYYSKQITA